MRIDWEYVAELRLREIRAVELHSLAIGITQPRPLKLDVPSERTLQPALLELRAAEVRSVQVRIREIEPGEWTAREVRSREIRRDAFRLAPGVPCAGSGIEKMKMFRVRHAHEYYDGRRRR